MTRRPTATPANPYGSRSGARRTGARPRRATTPKPKVVDDALTLPVELREASGLTVHTLRRLRPHFGSNVYADPRTGQVYSARLNPIGGVCADGYVRIGRGNRPAREHEQYAHRIVWVAVNGPIPDDKQIDHRNHQRADNRIANLQLLTPQQNNRKATRRRLVAGLPSPFARLTDDQVRAIRAATGTRTDVSWAAELGVSAWTVRGARSGKTYRHVKPCPRLRTRRRPGAQKKERP